MGGEKDVSVLQINLEQGRVFRQNPAMKCRANPHGDPQIELFKIELARLLDMRHPMVVLAQNIDWDGFEESFAAMWHDSEGKPTLSTRLMVALHYLKYTFDLSDEAVVEGWRQNPYWQYLSGMRYFEHDVPLDPSSMSRWRGRAGQSGLEELLQHTIRAGLKLKAITPVQLKRVNIDTTVEQKHIRFPTDSRLYNRARERLVKAARQEGISLRQTYTRVGKHLLPEQSRCAHARPSKRAQRCQKKRRTLLGRVMRDIEKKKRPLPCPKLDRLLEIARRIHSQQRHDKKKVYSMHEPQVECLGKGKAHQKYECPARRASFTPAAEEPQGHCMDEAERSQFGVKASLATTSRGGWHVGAMSCPGNPYDGHTLQGSLEQVRRLAGRLPEDAYVDMGYRGHGCPQGEGLPRLHVAKRRRGTIPKNVWRWMRRRSAVEPGIGHLKSEHRLERNRLWGPRGDMANVILSAAGMNFRKFLVWLAKFWPFLLASLLRWSWPCEIQHARSSQLRSWANA